MKVNRLQQCAVLVLIVAFCAFGQLAFAQTHHHYTIRVVPHGPQAEGVRANTLADGLYGTMAGFVGTPYQSYSTPTNSDGTDLWPCFAEYNGNSDSQNVDCPKIGDPSVFFGSVGGDGVPNAAVLGSASYTYSLSACDATSTSALPCGQTNTWYEDDSNDNTDDLIYIVEVEQGTSVIADSGTVDFGPNPYGGLSPAANIIIYGDQNFGTMGETGKNNGNCEPDFQYPFVGSPAYPFVIEANKTCVAPVAGPATLTATTEIATPKYKVNTKTGETTVTYTVKYKLSQKFEINLQ
jgi:hypothetical protein